MIRIQHTTSWDRGQWVEEQFANTLRGHDPSFRKATRSEQFNHIDYHSSFGTIDVKARKQISRSSKKLQDEFVWLEFTNVQGNKGWLAGGSDLIAFEQKELFVMVDRVPLMEWAMDKCDLEDLVETPADALYKGYTRDGRRDLISLVDIESIQKDVTHTIWEKFKP